MNTNENRPPMGSRRGGGRKNTNGHTQRNTQSERSQPVYRRKLEGARRIPDDERCLWEWGKYWIIEALDPRDDLLMLFTFDDEARGLTFEEMVWAVIESDVLDGTDQELEDAFDDIIDCPIHWTAASAGSGNAFKTGREMVRYLLAKGMDYDG